MKGKDFFCHDSMLKVFEKNNGDIPELDIINYIKKNLSNTSKNFVDIGAHIGTFSCALSDYFDKIHCFEPCLMQQHYLLANLANHTKKNKSFSYSLALSEKSGNSKFYLREPVGGTNGLRLNHEDGQVILGDNLPSYSVEVRTLDSFNFNNIGLIKIDVEGYELNVLNGAVNTIRRNNYPPIVFELNCYIEYNPNFNSEEAESKIFDFFKKLNYKIFVLKSSDTKDGLSKVMLAKRDNSLRDLINYYIKNPNDQYHKFWLGREYAKIGHWASGMGYFLSAAEHTDDDNLAYECLLQKAVGFDIIKEREAHFKNCSITAISINPKRPEAYYMLCLYYATTEDVREEDRWQQIYSWAQVGKIMAESYDGPELMEDIGYRKDFIFDYYLALSLWWIGRFAESSQTFKKLLDNPSLDSEYSFKCRKAMQMIAKNHMKFNT